MTQIRRLSMAVGSLDLLLVASMGAVSVRQSSSDGSGFCEAEFICLDGRSRFWKGVPVSFDGGGFLSVSVDFSASIGAASVGVTSSGLFRAVSANITSFGRHSSNALILSIQKYKYLSSSI